MRKKTFKEYCQTDLKKLDSLERKWKQTQQNIRKKLVKYVDLYGYDLSESDMEFMKEWLVENDFEVLKLNHQYDEDFKNQNKNTEISEEELELMFPAYIFK